MTGSEHPLPHVPESRTLVKKKTRLSLVWIIPIVAALIGAWIAVTTIMNEGPKITIVLRSAEGLEAGKTKIHYNGVEIGTITKIRLTDDHQRVIATASMAPKTEAFFVEDTKFWVVTPRVSGATISGLGTLISGAYIGMEIGKSSTQQRSFTALDTPPQVLSDVPGRYFALKSTDLGSVDYGTPIYFRRLLVGQVVLYELDKDGKTLTIKVFVNAPYDQYVTPETRFWQASGVDLSLSASGLRVQTQSVMSLLVGGIAFETPATGPALPPAEANTVFTLCSNRAEAYRPPPKNPQTYVLVFNQSVRGLSLGAPVEFRGIPIGQVEDIHAELDAMTLQFTIAVTISVDPQGLGVKIHGPVRAGEQAAAHRQIVDGLVSHGLRAQLRTGSLLTGSMFVAFDIFPDAPPFKVDWSQYPARLATVPGELEGIDQSVASIIKKLDKVQYQEISDDLRKTLAGVDQTFTSTRRTLDDADKLIDSNTGLNRDLANALHELNGAARSIRILTDYLEQHPESLIKGKSPAKGD